MRWWLLGGACASSVALLAYRLRTLTLAGAAAAGVVGTVTFARGGPPAVAALLAFFGGSSALSHYRERDKRQHGVVAQAKGARRDAGQVLANGGVATLALLLPAPWAEPLFLGALAAATADTWATEIGLLARHAPRLITTLRPVPPGTSGGVTPLGLLASALGAAVIGGVWGCFRSRPRGLAELGRASSAALLVGLAGSLVDSLLGATVQAGYVCPVCASTVEVPVDATCAAQATLEAGWPWVDNDVVNAGATLAGAAAGLAARHLLSAGSTR